MPTITLTPPIELPDCPECDTAEHVTRGYDETPGTATFLCTGGDEGSHRFTVAVCRRCGRFAEEDVYDRRHAVGCDSYRPCCQADARGLDCDCDWMP